MVSWRGRVKMMGCLRKMLVLLLAYIPTAFPTPPENASTTSEASSSIESNANSALAALAQGVTQLENSLSSGVTSMLGGFPGKRRRHHSNSTVRSTRRADLLSSAGAQHKTPVLLVAVLSDTHDRHGRGVVRQTWGRFANTKYWEGLEKGGSSLEKEGNGGISLFRRERETAALVDLRFFTTGLADWNGEEESSVDETLASGDVELTTGRKKASYAVAMIALLKWALTAKDPFQYLLLAPHGDTAYLRLPLILDELLEITHSKKTNNNNNNGRSGSGSLYWGSFAARQTKDSTFRA